MLFIDRRLRSRAIERPEHTCAPERRPLRAGAGPPLAAALSGGELLREPSMRAFPRDHCARLMRRRYPRLAIMKSTNARVFIGKWRDAG